MMAGRFDFKISLAAARKNAGLTQDEVSKQLKISNKTLSNWENGNTDIPFSTLYRLCDMYAVPLDAISLRTKST